VSDKIEEDKDSSSRTESNMHTTLFDAETLAHRALYIEHIEHLLFRGKNCVFSNRFQALESWVRQVQHLCVIYSGPRPDYRVGMLRLIRRGNPK